MRISLKWLSEYVPIELSTSELADALTMIGLEVESITDRYEYLNSIVTGKIEEVFPHPHSDHLKICSVNVQNRQLSIVCGAPNVFKGQVAPVALPGTILPDGTRIDLSVIRGVHSQGMICSQAELGIGEDKSGIMTLDPSLPIGIPISKALNLSDTIFQINPTPNRSDCLSMIGIAREVAAIQKKQVTIPKTDLIETTSEIDKHTSVTILAPDHCPRYAARLLTNVKIAPSPFWLADKIIAAGLKPINNIVDVTNLILIEFGQPLHAFDFDQLEEHRIVVRTATEGETFVTLDKKERILSSDMLMICDGKKPVALAGVMGGLNSEITDHTTRVLIESAYFNPVSIRKTSRKVGLSTEASYRFERGIDPELAVKAVNRAAELMAKVSGATIISGVIDEYPKRYVPKSITVPTQRINTILGTNLSSHQIKDLLNLIQFVVTSEKDDQLTVTPPSFRVDMSRPEDVMEEVARLYGYNNIPATCPLMPAEGRTPLKEIQLRDQIRQIMTGLGFTETINYSFISKTACDKMLLPADDPKRNFIPLLNPLTEDQDVMRTSLLPGLLETTYRNISQQVRNLKLFEVGKVFIRKDKQELPDEIEMVAGIQTGNRFDISWHSKPIPCDFFDIKGTVEGLLDGLKIENVRFSRMPREWCSYMRFGYTARIVAGNEQIGSVGEILSDVLLSFNIKQPVYFFELFTDKLKIPKKMMSQSISKYPAISRDVTLIIDRTIEAGRILETIKQLNEKLVDGVALFDLYEGSAIPSQKKSVSFRITYRSHEETLEDDTVNVIHKSIVDKIMTEFHATLPG